jgi:hypothetical protein
MSCSEKIPAYHFQFYFFLEKALRNGGFLVLAELHPWRVKGQENASRQHIDLYVEGKAYHFGIELGAGIENSKYKTYLERTEAYCVGFNDKHAFFILFSTIPHDLWSELWKGVESQANSEAGVFHTILSSSTEQSTVTTFRIPSLFSARVTRERPFSQVCWISSRILFPRCTFV